MIPDYSFDIYVAASARPKALALLQRRCAAGSASALDVAKNTEGEARVGLTLSFTMDHALAIWREQNPAMHTGVPMGEVHVGEITAWITHANGLPGAPDPKSDLVCITLWPVTRSMQIACLDSPNVRSALIQLLTDAEGSAGYVDRGDGSLAAFWPKDEAVAGYEHALARRHS